MINQLDEMLLHLLETGLNDPTQPPEIDVAVRPPDDAWRGTVNANGRPAVNIYLVEVREARDQRTSDALRKINAEPFRVDCHYIVSTWVPTSDPTIGTPTIVEDWLLGQVISILSEAAPINGSRIYGESPLAAALDPVLVDNNLPTRLLPPDGYPGLPDFWTGMGNGNTWHPSAHITVTLPIVRSARAVGPPVTTLHVSTAPTVGPSSGPDALVLDPAIDIGGVIRDPLGEPIEGAWIRLTDPTGTDTFGTATSDDLGRYRLFRVHQGTYRIAALSALHSPNDKEIEIPTLVGNYDLVLT